MIRAWVLPVLVLAGACVPSDEDATRASPGATTRDSAGVHIVENPSPALTGDDAWRITTAPVLEIGLLSGAQEYSFDRLGRVLRLSDRRLVVPNRGTQELRFFSEDGVFQKAVGGAGEGPGQFQSMSVWPGAADTIWVADPRLGRLTQLSPEGEYVRSVRLEGGAELGAPTPFGSSADGGFWATSANGGFGAGADGLLEGFEIFFRHHDADGGFSRVIAESRGTPQWAHTSGNVTSASPLPYTTSWTLLAADRAHLFLGSGDEPEVTVHRPSGELARVIRWSAARRPVGAVEIERFKADFAARWADSSQREFWNGWLRDVPFPDALPTFGQLLVDRMGHLWVREYHPPWEEATRWSVFSPEGEWLSDVEVPAGLTITDVGADYVLGRWSDELDVQYVRMYALRR